MADEKVKIKDIKGLEFTCNTCGLSLSYQLSTQKAFINECPNCGVEWIPHELNIQSIRGLKDIFKILSTTQGAGVSLNYTKEH